jgi:PPM family protein phosphatase
MIEQISYRTDLGEVTAAMVQHGQTGLANLSGNSENGKVQTLRTVGGLELLVAIVSSSYRRQGVGHEAVAQVQQRIIEEIRASSANQASTALKDALRQANTGIFEDPQWRGGGITAVVVAIHGKRAYLAQVGNSRAYLIRGQQAVQISRDQVVDATIPPGAKLPNRISRGGAPDGLLRYLGKDRNLFVDTQVYLPDGAKKPFIDLEPGDGLILCSDGVIEGALRQDALLGKDFYSFFEHQPVEMVADRLSATSGRQHPDESRAVIVLKSDETAAPVPAVGAGSCLSQVGVIATILILSIALGLGAAFGLPALMNPRTAAVPNTGSSAAQPGFFSVDRADGLVEVTYPGKVPQPIAAGSLMEAKPGMQVTTAQGKSKFTLADGTAIYVDGSTNLTLKTISNPKSNQVLTTVILNGGQVLVDSTRAADGIATVVAMPEGVKGSANGMFIGASYRPDEKRLDVDCMVGGCQVSGATASRDLVTGQHSWVINGVVGGLDEARWAQWMSVCDADCPAQSQAAPPPLTTPTFVPTQSVPIPYLGADKPASRSMAQTGAGAKPVQPTGLAWAAVILFGAGSISLRSGGRRPGG